MVQPGDQLVFLIQFAIRSGLPNLKESLGKTSLRNQGQLLPTPLRLESRSFDPSDYLRILDRLLRGRFLDGEMIRLQQRPCARNFLESFLVNLGI